MRPDLLKMPNRGGVLFYLDSRNCLLCQVNVAFDLHQYAYHFCYVDEGVSFAIDLANVVSVALFDFLS